MKSPKLEGKLGQWRSLLTQADMTIRYLDTPPQQTKWYLLAKLDIPWGPNIEKKADITIG